MLCPKAVSQQYPGTFPNIIFDRHRRLHQMVARKTCSQGNRLKSTLVPLSQSSITIEEIPSSMASPDGGPPSPLSYSFKTVFIKHAAVLDILCNHKQAIEDWSMSNPAICCCKSWSDYKTAALNPSEPHWVLSGFLLHSLLLPELAVIAEGSLSNKVFPSKKEYFNQMRQAIKTWTKKNGLPSMPQADISDLCHHLWSEHTQQITNHITKSSINQLQSTFDGAIFHCEDKHASSLRIYCPCLYYQSIENTFQDPSIFEQLPDEPSSIVSSLVESLHRQHGKAYPWAVGSGRQLPSGYILAKRKKEFRSGRPIISFVWTLPFDLCSISLPDSSSNSSLLPVPIISQLETSIPYCPSCEKHLSMPTSFWSTKIWQASLPVLTKTDSSAPGSCSWTFSVQR